jgi:hypothetical protein
MDILMQLYSYIAAKDQNENKIIGSIDFNTLIPMPNDLDVESGSIINELLSIYSYHYGLPTEVINYVNNKHNFIIISTNNIDKIYDKLTKALKINIESINALAKRYIDNIIKYGGPTWYEWRCNNWNTKWNAYEFLPFNEMRNYIQFNTAWSHVGFTIIRKIHELFPQVGIHYRYADEDFGNNCGIIIYENGRLVVNIEPQPMSNWAIDLSAKVLEVEPKEYGYTKNTNGIYEYYEEEDC